ncbi:MAG: hypothetical protein NWQ54_19380 [Paraglaciecola sp.]|uniref:hypothetical protein n=1 Tax=Pseudomonadati TaxID=3379134 RepID=UPI00273D5A4E|nr:hypothetical protein [Paraglaciecola sp.]MDP5029461.1 hypothetical protein [Paraglaciecola sp.]MDP5041429.1 hypothetical protein [Paraglaciecola sp.]MDP5133048.1 hypothetical protein [Paraglaciecola sp.]
MSVKINHYAQPIKTNIKTNIEAGFIEFFIGLICAAFAYYTYGYMVVLFLSTAFIAVICFALTIYNVYAIIQDVIAQKHSNKVQTSADNKQ